MISGDSPSLNGDNGGAAASGQRDNRGRFAKGNKGGPGNPLAKKANQLRVAMYASVEAEDIMEIMDSLIEAAKKGNITAAREVLDRVIGKPLETDVLEKIAELERLLGGPA